MATHLAMRSSYSLLQSTLSVEALASLTKARGFTQLALSDVGVLFGAKAFQKATKKYGLKPIYGLEVELEDDRLTLLAKNIEGYQQLIAQSSLINDQKSISLNDVVKLSTHCVVIQHSEQGILEAPLLQEDMKAIQEILFERQQLFRDYVCGISMQQSPLFANKNAKLVALCQQLSIPAVAFPKVYYADAKDEEAYRMLRAIDKNLKYDNMTLINQPFRHLLTGQEMEELYGESLCAESDRIADRCHVDLSEIKTELPIYENNQRVSSDVYFRELTQAGLVKRFNNKPIPLEYRERLKYEVETVIHMNYVDYFLIVYDFILYATKQQIYVGPGRGSAAGSLVAYCLGITHVDPIEYDLYFERFLNPERSSMPDIDTDFPDNRRDEVIDYVIDKYGKDHIAHIITFGTLAQKQVIRDVGKAYNAPVETINKLLKSLSSQLNATLSDSLKESKSLNYLLKEDKLAKKIFDMACRIEGLPRNKSTHAAGIVMSRKPLNEVIPTIHLDQSEHLTTQYSMNYLEEIGLVKMDFLGLRNLTIIDDVVRDIKEVEPTFKILQIPLDDPLTYQLIQRAHTVGIFQLESQGMKALLKKVSPTRFMDICDTIALFRPGPMRFRDQYVQNKETPANIELLHEDLREIVASSHGVLIYQEQIMQLARKFAGFSLGKADLLRRAMSKKNPQEMAALKADFIQGCLDNHYTEKLAEQLFEMVDRFAAYGFNKSHSVAYALIAYQMAYLKAHYPMNFYKSLLSSVIGSQSKLKEYLDECQVRGIQLLSPSVNHSQLNFTIEKRGLRMPLSIIASIGKTTARKLVLLQEHKGPFESFIDFVAHANTIGINIAQFKSLIYAGACDEFGYSRSILIASLEDVLAYANLIKIEIKNEQETLNLVDSTLNFGLVNEPLMKVVAENKILLSQKEKEVLGFYFHYHPILEVKRKHQLDNTVTLRKAYDSIYRSQTVAMVLGIREIRSKKGDLMAFIELEDEHDKIEAIIFNNDWEVIKFQLKVYQVYLIDGQGQKNRNYIIKRVEHLTS